MYLIIVVYPMNYQHFTNLMFIYYYLITVNNLKIDTYLKRRPSLVGYGHLYHPSVAIRWY